MEVWSNMNWRFLFTAVLALVSLAFITTTTRADDLQAMAGTWKVAAVEVAGKPLDPEVLHDLVVTIEGDHFTTKSTERVEGGTIKLDETKTPRTMDATKTEGFEAGRVIKAVYEITDDKVRVCYALDDSGRPTEVASKDGTTWMTITYEREK